MENKVEIKKEIIKSNKISHTKLILLICLLTIFFIFSFIYYRINYYCTGLTDYKTKWYQSCGRKETEDWYLRDNSNVSYQTKVDSQASVTVEVTPLKMGAEMQENIFNISLNTHSVDLNFDFQEIIILRDNLGNVYKVQNWTGGRGGHHLSGEVIFSELNKNAKTIKMEINSVGGVKRIFEWDI